MSKTYNNYLYYIRTFERHNYSINEKVSQDLEKDCYDKTETGTGESKVTTYTPKKNNKQATVAQSLCNKKENSAFFQLFSPLQSVRIVKKNIQSLAKNRNKNRTAKILYHFITNRSTPWFLLELMLGFALISLMLPDFLWANKQLILQNCISKKSDCRPWRAC